ncbi:MULTISPECIES: SDR family oxidoreductase [unclassified Carboxylicivirga]|uniref:SDR family oxidoreductase n=1 Tax=Carboxylicivirga TaxID=1628153 RepID=UPI003D32EE55
MVKKVLITGGARRVGAYLCRHMAGQGKDVIIHVNTSRAAGEQLREELAAAYPQQQFAVVEADLSDWKKMSDFINKIFASCGLPDLIIHNASHYLKKDLQHTGDDDMERMMGIHLFSPHIIGREFKKWGGKGQVITMLDAAIHSNASSHAFYLLAKKSLAEYTKMAALEWSPHIRVNGIALGPVLPPEGKDAGYFNEVVENSPMKSKVELENIGDTISFFLNNENVTGQIINCDSGQHLLM